MRYLSVCSGIEAVSVAWQPLGWQPAMFAEIDPFCASLLRSRYGASRPMHMPSPNDADTRREAKQRAAAIRNVVALPQTGEIPNFGDFSRLGAEHVGTIDLLVGGTPCQSFSIAGKRAGLDDALGNLTIEFARLAGRLRPLWLVRENVPGVLTIDGGRTFGAFLGILVQLGYGIAYRIIDAQYFGVPQRRRRVFVIGHLGTWSASAAVLLEWNSLSGNPPPRHQARENIAPTLSARAHGSGGPGSHFDIDGGLMHQFAFGGNNTAGAIDVATALNACASASSRMDFETETIVAHSLYAGGFDASEDGTGRGNPLIPLAIYTTGAGSSGNGLAEAVAFNLRGRDGGAMPEGSSNSYVALTSVDHAAETGIIVPALERMGHDASHAHTHAAGQRTFAVTTDRGRGVRERLIDINLNGSRRGRPFDSTMQELQVTSPLSASADESPGSSDTNVGPPTLPPSQVAVRRLTPRECERLQGFPDDYTLVEYRGKLAADGPRYKSLGNSMAVPVMRWIGQRIAAVHEIVARRVP